MGRTQTVTPTNEEKRMSIPNENLDNLQQLVEETEMFASDADKHGANMLRNHFDSMTTHDPYRKITKAGWVLAHLRAIRDLSPKN